MLLINISILVPMLLTTLLLITYLDSSAQGIYNGVLWTWIDPRSNLLFFKFALESSHGLHTDKQYFDQLIRRSSSQSGLLYHVPHEQWTTMQTDMVYVYYLYIQPLCVELTGAGCDTMTNDKCARLHQWNCTLLRQECPVGALCNSRVDNYDSIRHVVLCRSVSTNQFALCWSLAWLVSR